VQRGILRGLVRYGAQTVPELARARSVRRQSMQPVVDELAAAALVELVRNPKHASSKLVRITAKGEAIVTKMDRTDHRVLAAAGATLDARAIATTAETLRALRRRFETALRWRAIVNE
jgi:DNA-binding MarR family transcriptional regulator